MTSQFRAITQPFIFTLSFSIVPDVGYFLFPIIGTVIEYIKRVGYCFYWSYAQDVLILS